MNKEEADNLELRRKRHRNRELGVTILLLISVILGTWGQTTYFGTDSWLFMAVLNLNALFMLIIFFLTARNVVKLFVERKHKVFGSRLRTRLLLAFVSLSLIPVFLMFLAANRVVITSVDYWFTSTVASAMEAALDVGQSFYTSAAQRLTAHSTSFINSVNEKNEKYNLTWEDKSIKNLLEEKQKASGLNFLALIKNNDNQIHTQYIVPESDANTNLWSAMQHNIDWQNVMSQGSDRLLFSTKTDDYIFSILAIPTAENTYLISGESTGKGSREELASISKGFEEYTYLKTLKRPLKLSFSLILGLLGLIMIFSSIFMGFRLSREITAPIEALAQGTNRIAHGELDVMLEDTGKDELGQLVESFNYMTKQVSISNKNIKRINLLLEERSQLLEQRNTFIETILDNIATGVLTFDNQGKILNMNKAACIILNTKADFWINRNPYAFFPAREQVLFINMLEFLQKNTHKIWKQEIEISQNKHIRKILVTSLILPELSQPLENLSENISKEEITASSQTIIAVIEDITELSRVERLAAWREVARRIAHEMKNPLTPIRLSAERLQRKFSTEINNPTFTECTQLIINEVERMQTMIQNFTTYSSLPEVQLKNENLLTIVEESLQTFRIAHNNIVWEKDFQNEPLPLLKLDAETFRRALLNIYTNAVDVLQNTANPCVITSIRTNEDNCILTITDNGEGLSPEDAKHLFEPYYSNKNNGTGLGLAIVHSIINDHHGQVYASSNNPQSNNSTGTTFTILLPLNQKQEC